MRKKVAIVFGGDSPEHEVSLSSAMEVMKAIDKEKYSILQAGVSKDGIWYVGENAWDKIFPMADPTKFPANLIAFKGHLNEFKGNKSNGKLPNGEWFDGVDIAFPVMHGPNCEDGRVQALFELLKIPIAGCGVLASAVCMNKSATKSVLLGHGVPVTKGIVLGRQDVDSTDTSKRVLSALGGKLPLFAKPVSGGSSIGVTKIKTESDIVPAIRVALEFDDYCMIEEFINHRELMVAVMGPDKRGQLVMSPVGEVIPSQEIYDYADKYVLGTEIQVCPADVPLSISRKVIEVAERGYRALQCTGFARVDCFLNKDTGEVSINEVNTIPGFTGMSHFPKFMKVAGYEMKELITALLELAQ